MNTQQATAPKKSSPELDGAAKSLEAIKSFSESRVSRGKENDRLNKARNAVLSAFEQQVLSNSVAAKALTELRQGGKLTIPGVIAPPVDLSVFAPRIVPTPTASNNAGTVEIKRSPPPRRLGMGKSRQAR